ncbi:MAG: hypothetical protein H6828_07775 [Planctomycetes bacterium]|nr:hypothetical protein [Planctomycetota bacterium]
MKHLPVAASLAAALALGACRATPPGPVYRVEGRVARPGDHAWTPDTTVWEALVRARAVEGSCDLTRVELRRAGADGPLCVTLDLSRVASEGDSTCNVRVEPGDVIRVN